MQSFVKADKMQNVRYAVRGPVVAEAARMEQAGHKILKLNIGNPAPFGFEVPESVRRDMHSALDSSHGYSESRGIVAAREAIRAYAEKKGIPDVQLNNIFTGNGASELIQICMMALLNPGDEILIPSPDYPLWTAAASLSGGKVVHYVCDEDNDWCPDPEDIERKVTDRTKALVIINPNNPTGSIYKPELLKELADIARRHRLILFSDEIYDRLLMDGETHVSTAAVAPDLFCVTFSGLSKSHMACGYRVGWMILSGDLDSARDYIDGLTVLSTMRLCSNVPGQQIIPAALNSGPCPYVQPGGRLLEQRNVIYEALNAIPGVSAAKPRAAFYIFPRIDTERYRITDDVAFALDCLHRTDVLFIPGSGFNWAKPDHFRIVFLPEASVLKEATARLADYLAVREKS